MHIKKGFTLAEVLITLGIIGVVAGMTIPTLMNTVQERQFKEAAKEAYSKASQAVQQMKQDNGGDIQSYRTPYTAFKPVFMTYFKTIQDCNLSDCVADSSTSTVYKFLHGDPGNTHIMSQGQFVTSDGMFWAIYNGGAFLSITVDVNGYSKGPNVYGRDTFLFQLSNDNLVPMGTNGTYWAGACSNGNMQGGGCMYNVMQGIDYTY